MKLNRQQIITFIKTYLPLFIAYIILQTFALIIGFIIIDSWRSVEKMLPLSKWPDWYMCALSWPCVYYIIKYKLESIGVLK